MPHNDQWPEQAQTWEYTFFLRQQQLLSLVTQSNIFDSNTIKAFNDSMQVDGSYKPHPSDPALIKNIKALLNILVQLQAVSSLVVNGLNQPGQFKQLTAMLFQCGKIIANCRSIRTKYRSLDQHLDDLETEVTEIRNLPELKTLMHKILSETIGPQLRYFTTISELKKPALDHSSLAELKELSGSLDQLNQNISSLITKCDEIKETQIKEGIKDTLTISTQLVDSLKNLHHHSQSLIKSCRNGQIITAKSLLDESLEEIGKTVIKLQELSAGSLTLGVTVLTVYVEKLLITIQPVLITMISSLEMIEGQLGVKNELLQQQLETICQAHEKLAAQMQIAAITTHYPYWQERLAIRRERLNKLAGRKVQIQQIKKQILQSALSYQTPLQELILLRKDILRSGLINLGPYTKKLEKMIYERIGLKQLVTDLQQLAQECLTMQAQQDSLTDEEKLALGSKLKRLTELHTLENELRTNFDSPDENALRVLSYDKAHNNLAYGIFDSFKKEEKEGNQHDCATIIARLDNQQQSLIHEYDTTLKRMGFIEEQLTENNLPFEEKEPLIALHKRLISLDSEDILSMPLEELRSLSRSIPKKDQPLLAGLDSIIKIRSAQEKRLAILNKYKNPDHYKQLLSDEKTDRLSSLAQTLKISNDEVKRELGKSKSRRGYLQSMIYNNDHFAQFIENHITEINQEATKEITAFATLLPRQIHYYLMPASSLPPPAAEKEPPTIPQDKLPEMVMRIGNAPKDCSIQKIIKPLFSLKDNLPLAKENILKLLDERFIDSEQRRSFLASKNSQGYYAPQANDATLIKLIKSTLNILTTIEKLVDLLLMLKSPMNIRNMMKLYAGKEEFRQLFNQLSEQLSDLFFHFNEIRKIIPENSIDDIFNAPIVGNIYKQLEPALLFFKDSLQPVLADSSLLNKINDFLTMPTRTPTLSISPQINLESCIKQLDSIIENSWPTEKENLKDGFYTVNKQEDNIKTNILKLRNMLHNINAVLDMTVSIANKATEPQLLALLQLLINFKGQIPHIPPELAEKVRLVLQEVHTAIQPFFAQLAARSLLAEHQLGIKPDFFGKMNKVLCLKYEEYALKCELKLADSYPYTKEKMAVLDREIIKKTNESKELSTASATLCHLHSLKQTDLPSFKLPFADVIRLRSALKKLPPSQSIATLTILNGVIYKSCGLDALQAEITAIKEKMAMLEKNILQKHSQLTTVRFHHQNQDPLQKEIATLNSEKMKLQENLIKMNIIQTSMMSKLDHFDGTSLPFKYEKSAIHSVGSYDIDLIQCKSADFTQGIAAIDYKQTQIQSELIWLQQEKLRQQMRLYADDAAAISSKKLKKITQLKQTDSVHLPSLENAIHRTNNAFIETHEFFKKEAKKVIEKFNLKHNKILQSSNSAEEKQKALIALQKKQADTYAKLVRVYQNKKIKSLTINVRELITAILARAEDKDAARLYQTILEKGSDSTLLQDIKIVASLESSDLGRYARNKFNFSNLHDEIYAFVTLMEKNFPDSYRAFNTKDILLEVKHQQQESPPATSPTTVTTTITALPQRQQPSAPDEKIKITPTPKP